MNRRSPGQVPYVVGVPTTINEMLAEEIITGQVPRYRPGRDAVEDLCPLCYRTIWLTPDQKSDHADLTLETMLACAVCFNRLNRSAAYGTLIGRDRGRRRHEVAAASFVPQMWQQGGHLHQEDGRGRTPGSPGDEVPLMQPRAPRNL